MIYLTEADIYARVRCKGWGFVKPKAGIISGWNYIFRLTYSIEIILLFVIVKPHGLNKANKQVIELMEF